VVKKQGKKHRTKEEKRICCQGGKKSKSKEHLSSGVQEWANSEYEKSKTTKM